MSVNIPNLSADNIYEPKQIVALIKERGKVTGYKLSDGQKITKAEGINLVKQGGISLV